MRQVVKESLNAAFVFKMEKEKKKMTNRIILKMLYQFFSLFCDQTKYETKLEGLVKASQGLDLKVFSVHSLSSR